MLNAKSFQDKGYCEIVADDRLSEDGLLIDTLDKVYKNKATYIENMKNSGFKATNNYELVEKIIKTDK